ncbi:hypothetical protein EUGRSUZ_B03398, partial [Eucalyptus grandis]
KHEDRLLLRRLRLPLPLPLDLRPDLPDHLRQPAPPLPLRERPRVRRPPLPGPRQVRRGAAEAHPNHPHRVLSRHLHRLRRAGHLHLRPDHVHVRVLPGQPRLRPRLGCPFLHPREHHLRPPRLLHLHLPHIQLHRPGEFLLLLPSLRRQGTSICSFLYSCHAISMMNQQVSTCCVYAPVDLGPAYEMDLGKLKCGSYSGFYSFDGQEVDPDQWKYGIALKYRFNVYNEYPSSCAECERSGGACGYARPLDTFVCNCPGSGLNTTSDCSFGASWSEAPGHVLAPRTGTWALLLSVVSILSLVMIRAP